METAVLAGLRAEMKSPKVLAEYVKTYHEERKRLSAEADASRIRLERRADKLKREIDRLVDHLAKGIGNPYVIGPRSTELYHEREAVLAELAKAPPAFEVVSLHPAILKRYEEQLENLQDALAEGMRSGDRECAEAIRGLVETVTVYRDPSEPGAVEIEIAGRLNSILGDRAYPNGVKRVWSGGSGGPLQPIDTVNRTRKRMCISMVAGNRYSRSQYPVPILFRYRVTQ